MIMCSKLFRLQIYTLVQENMCNEGPTFDLFRKKGVVSHGAIVTFVLNLYRVQLCHELWFAFVCKEIGNQQYCIPNSDLGIFLVIVSLVHLLVLWCACSLALSLSLSLPLSLSLSSQVGAYNPQLSSKLLATYILPSHSYPILFFSCPL